MGEMRWDREGNARGSGRQGRKDKARIKWAGMGWRKRKRRQTGWGHQMGNNGMGYGRRGKEGKEGKGRIQSKTRPRKENNPTHGRAVEMYGECK
jgi:hypothetical protein